MDQPPAQCENVKMAPVKKDMKPLGRTFLKEWREHVGLDQEEAATRLNVSRTLLSKIENAKSPYTQRLLEAAAEVYGRKPAELIACDPTAPDGPWGIWLKVADASEPNKKQIVSFAKFTLGLA